MMPLRLTLFGAPRIERDGEQLPLGRRKALAILAYLAVTGQPQRRDSLLALLWPEYDPASARNNLRRDLSSLKKVLGEERLLTDRTQVELNLATGIWVDVGHFRWLLAGMGEGGDEERLVEAAKTYTADFMAGFSLPDAAGFDEWLFFERESLQQELAGALRILITHYVDRADYAAGIVYGRRWLSLDPLHEPAQRELMRLYAGSDQRGAAIAQYHSSRQLLLDELGVEPDPETVALFEQIRAGELRASRESHAARERKAATVPMPLAEPPRFLREDVAADTVPEICVGRDRELAWMEAKLATAMAGGGNVIFVSGEAGRGKTTLLTTFAHQAQVARDELVVASSTCNALTGAGDPFFPFRDIMIQLAGDVESRWAAGTLSSERARRMWHLLPETAQALIDHGQELLDTFVPSGALATRLGLYQSLGPDEHQPFATLEPQTRPEPRDVEQSQLFEQFVRVLHALADKTPLMLLVDDLQWADKASIGLLFHLARRLAGRRILLVGAYRPIEVSLVDHPLEPVRHELTRHYGEIELHLGEEEAASGRAFIDAFLDSEPNDLGESFRQALFDRTKGHPLFTVELLRDMQANGNIAQDSANRWIEAPHLSWETLPARIGAVIAQRLGRLDPELRDLLTIASVQGELFTAQVLVQVGGSDEWGVLRRLSQDLGRRHRLVVEREESQAGDQHLSSYQFSHALFQQYLYNELSPGERRLLHARVANALETLYQGATEEVTMQLAQHYLHASDRPRAISYARLAAGQAESFYAYEEAIQYLNSALGLIRPGEQLELRLELLEKLADLHVKVGDRAQAIPIYQETLGLLRGQPEVETVTLIRLHRKIGATVVHMPWYSDRQEFGNIGLSHLQIGLALVDDPEPHREIVLLLVTLANASRSLESIEDLDTAERYAKSAVEMAEQLGSPAELIAAREILAIVYGARDLFRERVELLNRSLALGRDPEFTNKRTLAEILLQTSFALAAVGEYAKAMPYLAEAEQLSKQVQATVQQLRILRLQAFCFGRLDRWDEMLAIEARLRALGLDHATFAERPPTCFIIALSASIHAIRGDAAEASRLKQEAIDIMIANSGPPEGWARDSNY
jgi:DNA-binding SARP family transcriptional activator/tetratricopeptide (TPR) repeat protein